MQDIEIDGKLTKAGLQPTAKRKALAKLMMGAGNQHLTADDVFRMCKDSNLSISLATIYNTLNHFSAAGLLRRISLDGSRTFFDTNVSDHHHIFYEDRNELVDLPADQLSVSGLPTLDQTDEISSMHVLVRVRSKRG